MTRLLSGLVVIAAMFPAGCGRGGGQTGPAVSSAPASDATTTAEVRAVLERYVKAVNEADDAGLRELWVEPEKASFVSPMQRMSSWDELQGFWLGFLKNSFSQRELKPSNFAIHSVGDAAWAVFDWEFSATMADGKPFQSRGWETHVYQKTEQGWRLRHIHYSAAMTPPPMAD
jgi:ketosteroid isomerase-like protein